MNLLHPWALLLLLLIPGLLWLRYGRRPTAPFSDGDDLSSLPRGWAVRGSRALPVLYALGLALLIVALARPRTGIDESRVRTEAVDIVLLVDVSTSMRAEDFSTPQQRMDRLDAAKQVIERFIAKRPDDAIGIVAFSAMPYTVAPLTLDHAWLLQQMERVQTGMLEDGTAIGDAVASAVNRLRDSEAKSKLVILLTDGINNRGKLSPEDAAQAAKALGIRVYTVGAGSDQPQPSSMGGLFGVFQQTPEIDEATLERIAETTDARYFRATDLRSLEQVYDDIDRMEKTEIERDQYTRYEERFAAFLLAALACLLLERALSFTRLGRLP